MEPLQSLQDNRLPSQILTHPPSLVSELKLFSHADSTSVSPDGDEGVKAVTALGAVTMLSARDSGGGNGTVFSADSVDGGDGTAVVPLVTAATARVAACAGNVFENTRNP